ncbi:MAG: hypothetical protein Q9O62_06480 [Ardenticatenia bacterium]|nr:hypothetical protein [Ardenticatenia bacterium]
MFRNNELIYPQSVTKWLAELRGQKWKRLVEYVSELPETHEDALAFQLMMVRLCGCLTCQPGGYKLSLGCKTCASRTVSSFSGSDSALLRRYRQAQQEVREFLETLAGEATAGEDEEVLEEMAVLR